MSKKAPSVRTHTPANDKYLNELQNVQFENLHQDKLNILFAKVFYQGLKEFYQNVT